MFEAFRCRRYAAILCPNRQAGGASTSSPLDFGSKGVIEFAINFCPLGDGFRKFDFGFRTLAARHTAAAQLGLQFVNMLF